MTQDIMTQAKTWMNEGSPVVVATIVHISGSSSQPLGTRMVMTTGNRFAGAVSGGCVETDVYETGLRVINSQQSVMLHYKHVENPLLEIGLNCDGKIDVLVEPLTKELYALLKRDDGPRYLNITVCSPATPNEPDVIHARMGPKATGDNTLPHAIRADADAAIRHGQTISTTYPDGRIALFEPVLPPPTLLIFGGEQTAIPLVRLARIMGYRTVVTDSRPAFATREKHPDADLVIAAWPGEAVHQLEFDERTCVVSLNHEPRFEDAMVKALAGRPLAYIGAIGRPVRAHERQERLQSSGFDLASLPRIHTPAGLDIGGKSSEEVALSIIAEIVAVKNKRAGGMLVTNTHEARA